MPTVSSIGQGSLFCKNHDAVDLPLKSPRLPRPRLKSWAERKYPSSQKSTAIMPTVSTMGQGSLFCKNHDAVDLPLKSPRLPPPTIEIVG